MAKKKIKEGLALTADTAERDHEVQMARSDLYKIAKYSMKLHEMMKNVSEAEGIEGWQQAKITKAADYLSSVYHSMDYEMNNDAGMVPESVKPKRHKSSISEQEFNTYKGSLNAKLREAKGICNECGNPSYTTLSEAELEEAHGNSKEYDKCWIGYEKVPGKTRGSKGSCKKKGS